MSRYIWILLTAGISRSAGLIASAYALAQDKHELLGIYGMLMGIVMFSAYAGSAGISNSWPIISTHSSDRLRKQIGNAQYPLLVIVAAFAAYGMYATGLVSSVNDSEKTINYLLVGQTAAAFQFSQFRAAQALSNGYLARYNAILASLSIGLPAVLMLSSSPNELCVGLALVATTVALFSGRPIAKTSEQAQRSHKAMLEVKNNQRNILLNVLFTFIGSMLCQLAQIKGNAALFNVPDQLYSLDPATFTISNQVRQAILFIPAAVGQLILVDLTQASRLPNEIPTLLRRHYYLCISIALACITALIIYWASTRGNAPYERQRLAIAILIFAASANASIISNFFSRLAQSKLATKTSLLFDCAFALPVLVVAPYLARNYGVIGVGIAFLIGSLLQLSAQYRWYFAMCRSESQCHL